MRDMEMTPDDILDRMSIIQLKIEHAKDPSVIENLKKEFEVYEEAINVLKEKGVQIETEWFDQLYEINGRQWNLEDDMNNARKNGPDLKKMGQTYIEIQKSNKRRVSVKREIIERTGKGFKDIEVN